METTNHRPLELTARGACHSNTSNPNLDEHGLYLPRKPVTVLDKNRSQLHSCPQLFHMSSNALNVLRSRVAIDPFWRIQGPVFPRAVLHYSDYADQCRVPAVISGKKKSTCKVLSGARSDGACCRGDQNKQQRFLHTNC